MINKAEQQLENRLVNEIDELKRQLHDIKTVQPLGADVLAVQDFGLVSLGPLTMDPGETYRITVALQPQNNILTLINYLWSAFIDNENDADYLYPHGQFLFSLLEDGKFFAHDHIDWALSSDSTNLRFITFIFYNNDSIAHDIYFRFNLYFPAVSFT